MPAVVQHIHAVALVRRRTIRSAAMMIPAALHRFHCEDEVEFFRTGSKFLIAAALPLAMGLAADVSVVFYKVCSSTLTAGGMAFIVHSGFW